MNRIAPQVYLDMTEDGIASAARAIAALRPHVLVDLTGYAPARPGPAWPGSARPGPSTRSGLRPGGRGQRV